MLGPAVVATVAVVVAQVPERVRLDPFPASPAVDLSSLDEWAPSLALLLVFVAVASSGCAV